MEVVETYSWDQAVYDRLLVTMERKEIISLEDSFGSIINVEKKERNEEPYIEVMFLPY